MGKRIIVYRHGKSDWEAGCAGDHDRPLASRGVKSAELMGRLLARSGQVPDRILCSTAIRAKETLEYARDAGKWTCVEAYSDTLYHGGCDDVLDIIKELPNSVGSIMLVGHEPTWSDLISRFIGGGHCDMPTAAMARIDLPTDDWSKACFGMGYLRWLLQPKFFMESDSWII
jgi:phosphohistidine phosphatase